MSGEPDSLTKRPRGVHCAQPELPSPSPPCYSLLLRLLLLTPESLLGLPLPRPNCFTWYVVDSSVIHLHWVRLETVPETGIADPPVGGVDRSQPQASEITRFPSAPLEYFYRATVGRVCPRSYDVQLSPRYIPVMASRDHMPPVHVPLRTSSRNPRTSSKNRDENMGYPERKTSKAQRILGTDVPPLPTHSQSGWENSPQKPPKSSRSSLRTPDSSSKRHHNSFVPFPAAGDASIPPQNLRVRASSPLLGHNYRSQDAAPPLPKPSKKVHQSGSSSTLFSYFSSKEHGSASTPTSSHGLQPRVQNELSADPQVTYKPSRGTPKESKRKLRPPRIDLSLLFPKPRNPAPPLFSPQRMVSSPSPVSTVVSDYPTRKPERMGSTSSNSTARRYGEPSRGAAAQTEAPKHAVDRSDLLSIPESKDSEWYEHPLERTVGTSEIDLALDRYAGRRSLFSRSSVYTASREQLRNEPQRPSETTTHAKRGQSPSSARRQDRLHLAPSSNSLNDPSRLRKTSSSEDWRKENISSRGGKSTMSRKSSKSTLKNKDLQNSSVLCLSSSEDEESERETPVPEPPANPKRVRDSVATYGEYEPEVYTAATAQAATAAQAQVLKRVDRAPSTSSHGSHRAPTSQPKTPRHAQNPSMSSTGNSSYTTRRTTRSRRSSGIPAISEPDILDKFPQQPLRTPHELKEMNRRSRVIAVTRQEQDLLEAMRQRKGKITPSIFNSNPPSEADRASVLSGPSPRDSFCGSDTSFLRLSAVFPPFQERTDQGATHIEKDEPAQSSVSDTEQKTGNSIASPQFSTAYSESLPSPSTSGASPITPTLPIHRFSPLPSPKPPPRGPPPAIPEDQKQHTRRRTDSSEAIMLNEGGDAPRKHDLPLWSFDFDWNHDRASVAAVH